MTKFFKKTKKNFFGAILRVFCTNLGQKWIFLKKRTLSVFQYLNYLPLSTENFWITNIWIIYRKSEKSNEPFVRKLLDGHTKNQFISLSSFWDTANFRVLQLIEKSCNPDWPREFWAIYQEPEFSQKWNLFKHTAITVL